MGNYTVYVEEDDHSFRFAYATPINVGDSIDGKISCCGKESYNNDVDVFKINLVKDETIIIETTGSTDTKLDISDSQGWWINGDSNSGEGNNCKFTFTAYKTGRFYLKIQGETRDVVGNYAVHVTSL